MKWWLSLNIWVLSVTLATLLAGVAYFADGLYRLMLAIAAGYFLGRAVGEYEDRVR